MTTALRAYIGTLGLDAYVVGGSVRDELLGLPHLDEDFLVPGVDQAGLRALLEPHGVLEDLEVHGQLVGVRLIPHDRSVRALARKGIEITPPRIERSIGAGHRDFEIVSSADLSVEEDMGRRDFTVNAIARRLATGELVDPFGGLRDLEARVLRTVSPTSFAEDPLRILRGLRLVSQLGFTLAPETLAQMVAEVDGLAHISPERIGGGIAADGLGELSKLLLGGAPAAALRLARDTGALTQIIPEYGRALGYRLGSERQPHTLDEHLFRVVQCCSDRGHGLELRLTALLHDLGKPETDVTGGDHATASAHIARAVVRRLRYPTRLQGTVTALVAGHAFVTDAWGATAPGGEPTPAERRAARRFLAASGVERSRLLVAHKRCDLATKHVEDEERARLERLDACLEDAIAGNAPHRLRDLALDGSDLLALGMAPGPAVGAELGRLLDLVVDDPELNTPDALRALVGRLDGGEHGRAGAPPEERL